jgi:hypothetical protein
LLNPVVLRCIWAVISLELKWSFGPFANRNLDPYAKFLYLNFEYKSFTSLLLTNLSIQGVQYVYGRFR